MTDPEATPAVTHDATPAATHEATLVTTPARHVEGTRGLALWLVLAGVAVATLAATLESARAGVAVLVATLLGVAAVRGRLRERRPEGLAIRSWPLDLATLLLAAAALTVLSSTPGV